MSPTGTSSWEATQSQRSVLVYVVYASTIMLHLCEFQLWFRSPGSYNNSQFDLGAVWQEWVGDALHIQPRTLSERGGQVCEASCFHPFLCWWGATQSLVILMSLPVYTGAWSLSQHTLGPHQLAPAEPNSGNVWQMILVNFWPFV